MRPWIWFEPVAGQGRQRRPTDSTFQALFLSAGDGLGSWTLAPAPTRAREHSLRPVGRRGPIHRLHPPDTHAETEPASQASGQSEAAASFEEQTRQVMPSPQAKPTAGSKTLQHSWAGPGSPFSCKNSYLWKRLHPRPQDLVVETGIRHSVRSRRVALLALNLAVCSL